MISDQLRKLVEQQIGDIHRTDRVSVMRALAALKVPIESEFAEFFLNFTVTFYQSAVSDEELCDICEPTEVMADRSNFVREVWGLPEKYICMSSVEGEGCYLYDRESGWVWDFSLADRKSLVEGKSNPLFKSFFDFLVWYLSN
jgi:hypothetical protein